MAYSLREGQASQEPRSGRANLETNTKSPPNSQTSSLDDSLSNQLSQVQPNAAGNLDLIRARCTMTPSTSLSIKPSQERSDRLYHIESDVSPMEHDNNSDGPVTDDALEKDRKNASKRMANGEVKPSEASLPTDSAESSQNGHSRNSSRTSRGSQIGELSNQLRTRLSYAMVKVQNGWQSHNINELESMTTNQASPVSTVSDTPRLYERHLPAKFFADQSKSMQLSEQTTAAPKYAFLSPRNGAATSGRISEDLQHGNFDHGSRPIKVGAAYESFWRDHEASGTSRPTEAPIVGPSLAPPADIVARSPRRLDATKKQPPPLRTNDLGTDSAPVTPPPRRQPKMRTLSQQAEVEKDAVETLLFMSSPGNPGYHTPGVFARNPLRNHFAHQADQTHSMGFSKPDEARSRGEQLGLSYCQHPQSPAGKRPLSNAEMDRILDEMTSSSDDGELQDQHQPPQVLGT